MSKLCENLLTFLVQERIPYCQSSAWGEHLQKKPKALSPQVGSG